MPQLPAQATAFAIGDWTVLPSRNVLARDGQEVRLEPRVMDVLVVLAERGGEPVSRDELTQLVWKRQFVSDDVLTVTVAALRKALGDDARSPTYVETVTRRGYRLMVPVQPASPAPTSDAPAADAPTPRTRSARVYPRLAAATAIAVLVGAGLTFGGTRRAHVPRPDAYDAYVKGRRLLDRRSIGAWQEALDQFRRAVALDAEYAAAHAGLADAYGAMSDFGVASPAEMRPRAMEEARRALDLDPGSVEGLQALGRAQLLFDWDFRAAAANLERAAALDSTYMPAFQALGWLESARGRHDHAVSAARRALQLDPVNAARYLELAYVLGLAGRTREALAEVERAAQLDPRSWQIYVTRGWLYEVAGQPDAAFASYRRALDLGGTPPDSVRVIESAYRARGLAGYYRAWLARRDRRGPTSETWNAQLYLRAGEPDSAVAALGRAFERGEGALAWVNVEPVFDPLRTDPRFQRIAGRVGQR